MGNNYTIEMSVSACNVLDKDVFSKSDPYCVLQVSNSEDRLEDSFQSETIRNTLNPEWKTPFLVDSYLEDDRRIRFTIYDADGKNFKGKEKRDYLGHADLHLQNLFKGTKKYCELDLYDQRNSLIENSKIKIKYEKISNCKDELKIEIRGEKLSKKGFFKVQHPFLEFYRVREDGSLFLAHKTENAKSSQSPEWKIKSLMKRFCNNDENYEMIIKCFDGHGFTPELIGECSMRLKDIGSEEFTFELQHPDKVKKKGNLAKSTGSLIVKSKTIKKKPGFLSYITEENPVYLMVAIDFTSSNGVPSDNFSLHWNSNPNPDELNSYQEVIQKIGNLIAEYKSEEKFVVLGFGDKVGEKMRECFALNGNDENPEVVGVAGIFEAYKKTLENIELSGPTLLSPVFEKAIELIKKKNRDNKFHIMLILTDGVVDDMEKTKEK